LFKSGSCLKLTQFKNIQQEFGEIISAIYVPVDQFAAYSNERITDK